MVSGATGSRRGDEPMDGMYGALDAELEVRRTIKRAELTAFLCLLRKADGPTMLRVVNKGIIDCLWRGEMRCIGPGAKDADLWILIWEDMRRFHHKGITGRGRAFQSAPHQEGNAANVAL